MARGLANDAIAAELAFTPKTVRNDVSRIFTKLPVADRSRGVLAEDLALANGA